MTLNKQKIILQFIAGIFGSTILGLFGFTTLMTYGGNYGCWEIINKIFNDQGYLSCGHFGSYAGSILGTIVAIAVVRRMVIVKYIKTVVYLLVGSIVLPFIFAFMMFSGLAADFDALLFITLPIIIIAMLTSTVPSGIITFLFNISIIFKQKK